MASSGPSKKSKESFELGVQAYGKATKYVLSKSAEGSNVSSSTVIGVVGAVAYELKSLLTTSIETGVFTKQNALDTLKTIEQYITEGN